MSIVSIHYLNLEIARVKSIEICHTGAKCQFEKSITWKGWQFGRSKMNFLFYILISYRKIKDLERPKSN